MPEAKKPKTATQSQNKTGVDFETPTSKGDLSTSTKRTDLDTPGKAATRGPSVNFPADAAAQASQHMGNLAQNAHLIDTTGEISDDEAARNAGYEDYDDYLMQKWAAEDNVDAPTETPTRAPETEPNTLPDVIRTTVMDPNKKTAHADIDFNPEWFEVRQLPGYMQQVIRAMGRQVFAPFTDTPIERIKVLSTLSNPENDVKKMAAWIKQNAVRDDKAELKFHDILPEYSAQTQIWRSDKNTYMVVKDFAGHYIYSWPGGRGVHLDAPKDRKKIR